MNLHVLISILNDVQWDKIAILFEIVFVIFLLKLNMKIG